MNNQIKSGRIFSMFMALQKEEQKNVRTAQYDNKDMVRRISAFMLREATKASPTGDEQE